jgi:3-methyladenine DNA glycosylase AlkD
MEFQDAMRELESLGTEQYRKTYRRHGVEGDCYGVSYASLEALRKKIKVDHGLAEKLWATGNHDARVLAAMIADPKKMDAATLDSWAETLRNHPETNAFANLAVRASQAPETAERWIAADAEFVEGAGWILLALLAKDPKLPDSLFEGYMAVIEKDIHNRKNRVREAMNSALIAIGGYRNPALEAKALAAAAKIGPVDIDHGDTGCKTPDAAEYIRKMTQRKKKG